MRNMTPRLLFAIMLIELAASAFQAQFAQASGVVYIKNDGTISPEDAPITNVNNLTYRLTGNIHGSIVIEKDDIILDGAGHSLCGTEVGKGILLSDRNNVQIINLKIDGFEHGIYLLRCQNNTVTRNDAANNVNGIWLSESSNNIITENHLTNNSYSAIGMPSLSDNNTISKNTISQNGYGIFLGYQSSINKITSNKIINNGYGIAISFSSGNYVYHNSFVNNTNQAEVLDHSSNIWNDSYPLGGNYWSDYSGSDNNLDGIGDTPYIIDYANQDNYPHMKPNSPYDLNSDGRVDVTDIFIVAKAFGSYPGMSQWNEVADVNVDLRVDLRDVYKVAESYGQ